MSDFIGLFKKLNDDDENDDKAEVLSGLCKSSPENLFMLGS